mmetsp:Transcript_96485/g.270010  ORF Transcript_96485/g.270010 Transcript_96485/m.270010 type:complete len:287 (+) Transcript_96485:648-1508(+)
MIPFVDIVNLPPPRAIHEHHQQYRDDRATHIAVGEASETDQALKADGIDARSVSLGQETACDPGCHIIDIPQHLLLDQRLQAIDDVVKCLLHGRIQALHDLLQSDIVFLHICSEVCERAGPCLHRHRPVGLDAIVPPRTARLLDHVLRIAECRGVRRVRKNVAPVRGAPYLALDVDVGVSRLARRSCCRDGDWAYDLLRASRFGDNGPKMCQQRDKSVDSWYRATEAAQVALHSEVRAQGGGRISDGDAHGTGVCHEAGQDVAALHGPCVGDDQASHVVQLEQRPQ